MKTIHIKGRSVHMLTMRISLPGTVPEVWREVVVPDTQSFKALHDVIQVAMGWTNSHLHAFQIGKDIRLSSPPDSDDSFGMVEDLDDSKVKLNQFLTRVRQNFEYEYDFGDSWRHKITIIKVTPVEGKLPFKATILGGENACPPEDCGGVWGYQKLKEAWADPKHPEHEELREWAGDDFNPTAFAIEPVRKLLEGEGASKFCNAMGY